MKYLTLSPGQRNPNQAGHLEFEGTRFGDLAKQERGRGEELM